MQGKLVGASRIAEAMGVSISTLAWHRKSGALDGVVDIVGGQLVSTAAKCRMWRAQWDKLKKRGRPLQRAGR